MTLSEAQVELVERLAGRCRHQKPPCQACTNLAVWAVETLAVSGWWTQIAHTQTQLRKRGK